jgi:LIM domain
MEYEGKAYCTEDYSMLFANRCAGCERPLIGPYMVALNKNWHKECFVCREPSCTNHLTKELFYEHQGFPYCEYHYYALQSNICASCRKPVIGRCVVALDKKWHPDHFKCAFCQKQIDTLGTGAGYKERNGKAYDASCYLKLFC